MKLDFTLETADERKLFIDKLVEENTKKFTEKELELMANYILYGKDVPGGKSIVDKKEVHIKPKYSSYTKKEPESLEALLESPTFNETATFAQTQTQYKAIKPKIDREEEKDIPSINTLWTEIDKLAHIIKVNQGKEEDPSVRRLTPLELYKMKHTLIDMRRQQFALRDIFKPTIFNAKNKEVYVPKSDEFDIPWNEEDSPYQVAPLGLYSFNNPIFENPRVAATKQLFYYFDDDRDFIIDFRDPTHIYELLERYEDLSISAQEHPTSGTKLILDTLEFYIGLSDLTEVQNAIISLKIRKYSNLQIQNYLKKNYSCNHSVNYISTIYKQKICREIADAAILHYDYFLNGQDKSKWKRCSVCGEFKLKDSRGFVRKARSSDGFSNKCKKCDKEDRDRKKGAI